MAADSWTPVALEDLIEIKHGYAFKGEYFRDEPTGNVLLTPGNFAVGGGFKEDKLKFYEGPIPDEFLLQPGDLLVTMTDLSKQSDTLGYPALVPRNRNTRYLHNQRLGKVLLRPQAPVLKEYLYYVLRTAAYRHEIVAGATGTTVKHTSPSRIYGYKLLLPPIEEQRRISHILSLLDDKIELNRRMNETLEEMARALFKSWFADFDPVRAKMEGRRPAGMDDETAALFPDSFEDSPLGELPKGWRVGQLKEVVTIHDSKRIPLSGRERSQRKGLYPYYGAASVMDYVDSYLFDGTYLLVGEDGSVITVDDHPVTQYVWGQFWVNNHAHVLQGKEGVSTEHVLLSLRRTNINAYVTGAVQPKLNQRNMKSIPFVLASRPVHKEFEERISPLFNLLKANEEQSRTLAAIRASLLPKLLSGEMRVSEVEEVVEDVV